MVVRTWRRSAGEGLVRIPSKALRSEERKAVVRQAVCQGSNCFSGKSHCLTVTFSKGHALEYFVARIHQGSPQESLYQEIPQCNYFFHASILCLNITFPPWGQQKFMLLFMSKIMSLLLNKQILIKKIRNYAWKGSPGLFLQTSLPCSQMDPRLIRYAVIITRLAKGRSSVCKYFIGAAASKGTCRAKCRFSELQGILTTSH